MKKGLFSIILRRYKLIFLLVTIKRLRGSNCR